MSGFIIRKSFDSEKDTVSKIYPEIFPEEDLQPLVRDLLNEGGTVLSLVAVAGDEMIGHVVFTICAVEGSVDQVGLLGPLGVLPDRQGQGIGSALIQAGFKAMKERSICKVCVLGDPDFYSRYGFLAEKDIKPPYDLPAEWVDGWQSLTLDRNAPQISGALCPPGPWRVEALWLP